MIEVQHFVSKPMRVEAVLWDNTLEAFDVIQKWSGGNVFLWKERMPNVMAKREFRNIGPHCTGKVYDELAEAYVPVHTGQWIIKGSEGEFYPCDQRVIDAKYVRLEPINLPSSRSEE